MNPIASLISDHVLRWRVPGQPLIVGVCGTQASGKSTACAQVKAHLASQGLAVGVLGLDDLYHGRAIRAGFAKTIHPLFATRGPPGTHNINLGLAVVGAVLRGEAVRLPRFDKRADEPVAEEDWPVLPAPCDILLFEGWCVGARPVNAAELDLPVNELERVEDRDFHWRRTYNAHLRWPTGSLFEMLDRLIYLRPPRFEIVQQWRYEQERANIATDRPEGAPAAMTEAQVARFISHFERMTRHMMEEVPYRADLVIQLDDQRAITSAYIGEGPAAVAGIPRHVPL